jgi:mannose-6-phosphate isomerase-like protein (cupin superfamily)
MTVTDDKGGTLAGVHVELTGPISKADDTNTNGQLNFPGLQAGTYRLRFTGDGVTAFEREVTLRGGAIERLEIKLSAAPAESAAPAPAAAPPPALAVGPTGAPQLGSLTNLAERERNTREPRREVLLSCSGNTRNMLLVLTQEQPQRIYDSAETTYYVLSGQGTTRVGALQSVIGAGWFIAVPRGTAFSLAPDRNKPLELLWTLSGESCEQAK